MLYFQSYPEPLPQWVGKSEEAVSTLVDKLLIDIYGSSSGERSRSESEYSATPWSYRNYQRPFLQRSRLELKSMSLHIYIM